MAILARFAVRRLWATEAPCAGTADDPRRRDGIWLYALTGI